MEETSISMRAWLVLAAMMVLVLLINVDYTAVNIAMLPISKEFGSDLNNLQWLLSGYVLAWASLVIPAGQMADIYGKRRILLYGIMIFMLSSIMCGVVNSTPLLILARILQGFGGALFVPPLYALVFEFFPENRRGFAIGMLGVGAGIGLAIGPTFGGFIVHNFGWRWIFLVNGPLCSIAIAILLWAVEKEKARFSDSKVDVKGGSLLAFTLMSFIYALNQSEVWGLKDPTLWGAFAMSVIFLIGFLAYSKRSEHPLIPRGFQKQGFCWVYVWFWRLLFLLFHDPCDHGVVSSKHSRVRTL